MQGATLGRYRLDERISVGGMGEVYLGTQTGLSRYAKPVVVKLLLPHLVESREAVEMFLDEARIAARMTHPNVVQTFDLGLDQGRYYLAMELVRGVSLGQLVRAARRTGAPLPASVLTWVGWCLCEGLHYAHQLEGEDGRPLQVVHRDVSPQNVLVSVDGDVKVTDFGIAKARDSVRTTRPGTVKGTLEYVAPEQIRNEPVDRRADLFSAGLTLFELAALDSPFRRDSDAATLHAVLHEPLPSLSRLRPDLPKDFVATLERATAKVAGERFDDARAMRDALSPVDTAAREELARHVVRACQTELAPLDEALERSRARQSTEAGTAVDRPGRTRRRRAGTWAALGVAGAVAAGGLYGYRTATKTPTAGVAEPLGSAAAEGGASGEGATTGTAAPAPDELAVPASTTPEEARRVAPGEPRDAPARPPPTRESGTRAREVRSGKPEPKLERGRGTGYLSVDAQPWAVVYVDGRRIGETPLDRYPLERGSFTVRLVSPDTGKSATQRVRIGAGVEYVKVDLR